MTSSRVEDKGFIFVLDSRFVMLRNRFSEREVPRAVEAEAVHFRSGWDDSHVSSCFWMVGERRSRVAVAFRSCPSRRQLEACHRITNTTIPYTISITNWPPTTS